MPFLTEVLSAKKFDGKTAKDVTYYEYAGSNTPFGVFSKKLGKYSTNSAVLDAIAQKATYKAMVKEISKAWRFHGKQKSTLHILQSSLMSRLLIALYASHPDAPDEMRDMAYEAAKAEKDRSKE